MKAIPSVIVLFATIFLAVIFFSDYPFSRVSGSAGITAADRDLHSFTKELETYRDFSGHYPGNEQGLGALLERPVTDPLPKRWVQLRREIPNDPWETAYRYLFPGKQDPDRPEIISAGPDRTFDTPDDLSNQD